jgi:hypothetical protein
MASVRLRPRFELSVSLDSDRVLERFRELLRDPEVRCTGDVHSDHVDLGIPDDRQHFWSPFLKIVVHSTDRGARLEGHFGPNSNVWTMFLGIYAFFAFSGLAGIVVGFSQWTLGQTPTGFWVAGICTILYLVAYGVALFGQYLASDQMDHLSEVVHETFDDTVVRKPPSA